MRNSNDQYTTVCGSQPSQCLHMCLTLKTNNASTVFSVEGINDLLGCKEFFSPTLPYQTRLLQSQKKEEEFYSTLMWYLTLPAKCWITKVGSVCGDGLKYGLSWCCFFIFTSRLLSVASVRLKKHSEKEKYMT